MIVISNRRIAYMLEHGDLVKVPNNDTIFRVTKINGSLYLTTVDSDIDGYLLCKNNGEDVVYSDYIQHFREKGSDFALLTKNTLWELIKNNNFYIG